MNIKQYVSILKRRAWLLVIGWLIFTIGSYIGSLYLTPIFQASTKLLVSRPPDSKTSDFTYLSDQQLAQTYIQLITTDPVLQSVGSQIDYEVKPEQIGAQLIRDTLIIRITVDDNDPLRATNIANGLVRVLIEQNEIIQSSRYSASEQSLQTQLNQVESQIANLQKDIAAVSEESLKIQQDEVQIQIDSYQSEIITLQQQINDLNNNGSYGSLTPEQSQQLQEKKLRLDQLQTTLKFYQQIYLNLLNSGDVSSTTGIDTARLDQMKNTLVLYQQIYTNLLSSYESVRLARLSTTPNIVQVEVAAIPEKPIRPKPLINAALGGIIGLLMILGVVFLIEYIDDTVKSPEDIDILMKVPVMSFIGDMGNRKNNNDKPTIYVVDQPRSPVAEAFRTLRTNLEFAGIEKPIRTLTITSPSPGEGKTTVTVNLAMTIAQSGKKVTIVDADLRRPNIHRFLTISNRVGLSDVLTNRRSLPSVCRPYRDSLLSVVSSGNLLPNPSEILASTKLDHFLDDLQDTSDLIIVDSPPILVSDASILASMVDGVIIVVNPGQTQRDAAWATYEQLKRVNANVIGVVFNRIPKHRSDYYGNYHYYAEYYYGSKYNEYLSDSTEKPPLTPKMDPVKNNPKHSRNNPQITHSPTQAEEVTRPSKPKSRDHST